MKDDWAYGVVGVILMCSAAFALIGFDYPGKGAVVAGVMLFFMGLLFVSALTTSIKAVISHYFTARLAFLMSLTQLRKEN